MGLRTMYEVNGGTMKQYKGLDNEAVVLSRKRHGSNRLKGRKKASFFQKLLSNFSDPIVKILLAALLINVLFTLQNMNLYECLGIMLAILVSAFVSTISEYGSENAFEKMLAAGEKQTAYVFRNSELISLSLDDIVVGDMVLIEAGEAISADGILIEGNVSVDQSALNGESRESKKRPLSFQTLRTLDAENRVFRGSLVTQGRAVIQVTEVGENTFLGGVAKELTLDTRESPMKLRLSALAKTISRIGYVLAAVVALSYLFGKIVVDNGFSLALMAENYGDLHSVLSLCVSALTLAVTVVVVAVPEGLPMMICVVLSSNMKRMLKDQILVKKMVGIETAGSMNLLFCDKTGTITNGVQSVEGIVLSGGEWIQDYKKMTREAVFPYLLANAVYNTDCQLVDGKIAGSNATDRAIVSFFAKDAVPRGAIYGGVPFHSRYKYSAAMLYDRKVVIKGAPEVLFPYMEYAFNRAGEKTTFDKTALMKTYRTLTSRSSRVLAVALADRMPSALGFPSLTLVALVAIRDTVRKSAYQSVKTLHEAGIAVVMMTGDGPDTARAIANEVGIISNTGRQTVLTGSELAAMTDTEVAKILPHLAVLSRALPQDKTRLVRIAQSLDLVVGMTGDGVNDAPALKLSDVGFAMGSGTDIAKEAGDIVILNNDILAIVKAVLYGRTIFKSICKFIVFQLTMNLCAVSVTLIGPLLGIEAPITIMQMLWINMIMDTLGGLAFAGEAPTPDTMREVPKKRTDSLLTYEMLGKILWNGFMTLLLCMCFMSLDYIKNALGFAENPLMFYSAFFSLFVFLGIMQFFNARTERINLFANLKKNRSFMSITALVMTVQLLMVFFGGTLFRTTPLSLHILLGLLAMSFAVIPLDVIRKAIMRIGNTRGEKKGTVPHKIAPAWE